jgi:hypothetical protein
MQSSDLKSFDDYIHDEVVFEGSRLAGVLEVKIKDPSRPVGYLLVKSSKGYTIYQCCSDARTGVCLCRNIPEYIMRRFAQELCAAISTNKNLVRVPVPFQDIVEKHISPLSPVSTAEKQGCLVVEKNVAELTDEQFRSVQNMKSDSSSLPRPMAVRGFFDFVAK